MITGDWINGRYYELTQEKDCVEYMSQSVSQSDWWDRYQNVKLANGGYPSFWFQAVIKSGMYARLKETWKLDTLSGYFDLE